MTVSPVIPEAPAQIPSRSNSSQNSDDQSNDFHSYLRSSSRDDTEETSDSKVHERAGKPTKREKQTNKADKEEKTTGANAAPVQPQTNQPAPPPLSIAALLGMPTVQKIDTAETGKVTQDDGTAALSSKNAQPGDGKAQSKTGVGATIDPAALLNSIAPQLLNITDQTDKSKVDPANTGSNAIGSEVKGSNAELLTAGASPSNTPTAAQAPGNLAFALRLSEGELSSKLKQPSLQTGSTEPMTGAASSGNTDFAAVVEAAAGSQLKEQSHHHDEGTGAALYELSGTQPQNIADKSQLASEQPAQTTAADLEAKQEAATLEPVRNVHMQVIGDNNNRVDVRLMDRGGELHVSVKSGDVNLAQNLQDHMPELTSRLDQQRFQTEVWMPGLGNSAKAEMSGTRDFASGGNNSSNNSNNNNSDQQGKGQQQYKPDWVDVLENSTRGTGKRDQTWHQ